MNRELVDVKALVAMEYDGRSYSAGDWFKAAAVDALTMGQAGRVSLNREYGTRALTATDAPKAKPSKPSRRGYARRDLVAESN